MLCLFLTCYLEVSDTHVVSSSCMWALSRTEILSSLTGMFRIRENSLSVIWVIIIHCHFSHWFLESYFFIINFHCDRQMMVFHIYYAM